ncbi:MAG: HAMP domain-containing sensor histidine kinase [Thermostichales cyanobacterium SRBZ-1_bins_19]
MTSTPVIAATRRRLALWYSSVTAVLLLLFAIAIYWYVQATLVDRVDDTLNHVVEVLQGSPNVIQDFGAAWAGDLDEDHIDLEWFDPEGHLLWSTLSSPLGIPLRLHWAAETVDLPSGASVRQMTRPLMLGSELLGYVRVSHPWFEVTKPTQQLAWELGLGIVGMVMAVAAVGWWLSGVAMAPVLDSYQRLKQFTADASHELRNPIASMQTQVQVILQDPALGEGERQLWQGIERQAQRLGRLVEDLLFLARQDHRGLSSTQCCPVDAIVMDVVDNHQALAHQQQLQLSLEIDSGSATDEPVFNVDGDYDQLQRLFTNLISNAIQYTPPGGSIHVHISHHPKGIAVQVRDTGIGIPAAALPRLFDRFYRVDPTRRSQGSGLGLAIAHSIVQLHQGEILVESQPNHGSTFTVLLPRSRDPHCQTG